MEFRVYIFSRGDGIAKASMKKYTYFLYIKTIREILYRTLLINNQQKNEIKT